VSVPTIGHGPTPPIVTAGARAKDGPRVATPILLASVFVVGCGALAARYTLAAATPRPTTALVLLLCALLGVGASLPISRAMRASRISRDATPARAGVWTTTVVALVGITAFAAGRVLAGGRPPFAVSGYAVVTSCLAAVSEEAWFRRLGFGLLEAAGPAFAIGGSTVLFAVVHVAAYGWWVLPIDLAAGALLGWQRWVSGSWTAPAVTHVIANLLVLL
jgi:hypothetical protein